MPEVQALPVAQRVVHVPAEALVEASQVGGVPVYQAGAAPAVEHEGRLRAHVEHPVVEEHVVVHHAFQHIAAVVSPGAVDAVQVLGATVDPHVVAGYHTG